MFLLIMVEIMIAIIINTISHCVRLIILILIVSSKGGTYDEPWIHSLLGRDMLRGHRRVRACITSAHKRMHTQN